jgi:tricorn protease
VLSILRRKLAGQFVNREGASTTLPGSVPPAAMTVLTNKFSSSDGDQFPYYFREYGLGRIIGSRTWGGVRGIKGPWTLMDGTYITVPKDSLYSTEGRWIIENRGTEPDIEVPDSPLAQTEEIDAQLAAGLQLVTRELVEKPPAVIPTPPLVPSYPAISDVPPASFHDRNTHRTHKARGGRTSDSVPAGLQFSRLPYFGTLSPKNTVYCSRVKAPKVPKAN